MHWKRAIPVIMFIKTIRSGDDRGRWQSRRTLCVYLILCIQLDNTHIIVKNPENDPKMSRMNSTTKGSEEVTSRKLGKVKM